MKKVAAFVAATLALALVGAVRAQAAAPLVTPVIVPLGAPVHLTPHGYDAGGAEVPLGSATCTVVGTPSAGNLPTTLVTVSYDATGAILTAVGTGSGNAQWKCVNGATTVNSATFVVTVPWNITAVGDTSP